jgi:hypothetical protein
MKTITISVVAMVTLLTFSIVGAQDPVTVRSAGTDLLAGRICSGFRVRRSDFMDRHPHSPRLVGSGICRSTLDVGGALAAVADRNIPTAPDAATGSL